MPRLTDKIMEKVMIKGQYEDKPQLDHAKEGLFKAPKREGEIYGSYEGRVRKTSFYTFFALRPALFFGMVGTAVLIGMNRRALMQLIVKPANRDQVSDTVENLREAA